MSFIPPFTVGDAFEELYSWTTATNHVAYLGVRANKQIATRRGDLQHGDLKETDIIKTVGPH